MDLPNGFTSHIAHVNGIELHYVRGGSGPALLLIHGFPQDWYEWRAVMPRLTAKHTVIAVDLRGVGESEAPQTGYDAPTLAQDLYQLVGELGLDRVTIVGHDIGGWVAYAFGRSHPERVSRVVILETLLPGIEPFDKLDIDVPMWHAEFHMIPGLPEALVAGRQAAYFGHFFEIGTRGDDIISEEDVQHYAAAYGDAAHLRSAFEVYRAIPANIAFNSVHTDAIDVPLLLIGGEHVFGPVMDAVADNLRSHFGWSDVTVSVLADGRHYVVEEMPDDVAELIVGRSQRAV
jgi:pimeloyl-ACP methyl ester carboxylesterase